MSDYEERKQARIDRYRERAEQARQESVNAELKMQENAEEIM